MIRMIIAAAFAANVIASPAPALARPVASQAATVSDRAHLTTTLHGNSGPAVVLIPGLSTPADVWDDMAASLAADHRVLVVGVKGFDGQRATANEKDGMIDGIVADLATDLHARGFHRPVVTGHSFGGLVAMKYALAHPATIKSVVVVDALPFFGTVFDPQATAASIAPRGKQMRDMMIAQAEAIRAMGKVGVTKDPGGTMSLDPTTRIRIANWSMKSEPLAIAQAMWEDIVLDLRPAIGGIRVPLTVLYNSHGDGKDAAARYSTDYAAKADTRLVPVKNTGHFIQLDQPEAVEAAVKEAAR
jgi:pimeloyl-ACP methyl ester carboxylesterase